MVTTHGFGFYESALKKVLGTACLYDKVIKSWCNNRVRVVKRTNVIGSERELEQALERSEDSDRLNTAFIERLKLMIHQGSSYLARRSPTHVRSPERLREHVKLLRCYYNCMRPHRALKFGSQRRTPKQQAGIAPKRLTFREVFGFAWCSRVAEVTPVLRLVSNRSSKWQLLAA